MQGMGFPDNGGGKDSGAYKDGFTALNIILIILGLGSLGIGIWLNAERDVKAYLVVFGADPDGNMLIASTALFITGGLLLIGAAVLGIVGVNKRLFLTLYCVIIIFVLLIEFIAGFLALAFHEEIHKSTLSNMQQQIKHEYEWDNKVGEAWNRVQVRRRCCGANAADDFRCSDWWYGQEENAGYGCPHNFYSAPIHVPDSCCVLEMNQDRDPEHVNPQNPLPKNKERCNEDTAGNMWAGSSNVHGRGCYTALQDLVYTHIYVLMGVGIGIGLIQFASLTLGILRRRHAVDDED